MSDEDWAIVAGIGTYPAIGNLSGPENDALAFHEWLTDPNGGAIPPESGQVRLIRTSEWHPPPPDDDRAANPKMQEFLDAFDAVLAEGERRQKERKGPRVGRRLYIYFAGHGFSPRLDILGERPDDAALLMANATDRRSYHVPGAPIASFFLRDGRFDEVVLLMDCCRYPAKVVPPSLPPWVDPAASRTLDPARAFFGFATKLSKGAREKETAPGVVRGLFTSALIEGLRGAACEPNGGPVTGDSLKRYLRDLRFSDPDDPGNDQQPQVVHEPDPQAPIELCHPPPPTYPVEVRFPPKLVGQPVAILSSPSFDAVQELAKAPDAVWSFRLQAGFYLALAPTANLRNAFEVKPGVPIVVEL